MFVLSLLPVVGAAVVWVPAALWLALERSMSKALLLLAWGGVVVALVDNLLYPLLDSATSSGCTRLRCSLPSSAGCSHWALPGWCSGRWRSRSRLN